MKIHNPTYRWHLTENQTNILTLLQALRFTTTDILAELLHKDRSTIYERLSVLEQQNFVIKQYNASFRIRQRPATYCLGNAGIRALEKLQLFKQNGLKQRYKDKSFSEEQIDSYLRTSSILLNLRRHHKGEFLYYTQYQIDRNEFIRPTPLLHVVPKIKTAPEFLVDFIPALTPSWLIRKRIRQHENFADEDNVELYPHVLFIAGNHSTERRIVNFTQELYNDFKIFTTTFDLLTDSPSPNIWQNPEESLDLYDDEKPQRLQLPNTFDN
jgi:hypothetical protein